MKITAAFLKKHEACEGQYRLFKKTFPKGASINLPTAILAAKSGFDLDWLARRILKATAWAEYQRVTAPAWAEYERVTAPAWAEYQRVKAQALAEYERVTATAWAEYQRVTAPALIAAWEKQEGVKKPTKKKAAKK